MAIGGIQGNGGGAIRPGTFGPKSGDAAAQRADRERSAIQAGVPAHVAPATVPAEDGAIPVEAPPGTDPALWSVLTADERRYFAKLSAMGPLTYGRRPTPAAQPQVRGARIDMTV